MEQFEFRNSVSLFCNCMGLNIFKEINNNGYYKTTMNILSGKRMLIKVHNVHILLKGRYENAGLSSKF